MFFPLDFEHELEVDVSPFELLFTQLQQMMDETDNPDLGSHMLRRAAIILTMNELFGKVQVTADFGAYAIDWSIEGHDNEEFEELLGECGVTAETIAVWKQKGMLS